MPAKAGDVLLSIPRAVWQPLSAAHVRQSLPSSLVARADAHAASIGAGASFGDAALLAHHLAHHSDQCDESQYLAWLPHPDVPLLWPEVLKNALLRGTSAGPAADSQTVLSDGVLAALEDGEANDERRARFRWAQAILLSRAHSGEGKPLALVPGLDLLNHGGEGAGACVRFNAADAAFDLVATRAHAEGEDVLIDYGTRASHRLLRLYGFVTESGDESGEGADNGSAGAEGNGGGDAAVRSLGGVLPAGEEVQLPLLPSAAELEGAPEEIVSEIEAARAALRACGVGGARFG